MEHNSENKGKGSNTDSISSTKKDERKLLRKMGYVTGLCVFGVLTLVWFLQHLAGNLELGQIDLSDNITVEPVKVSVQPVRVTFQPVKTSVVPIRVSVKPVKVTVNVNVSGNKSVKISGKPVIKIKVEV